MKKFIAVLIFSILGFNPSYASLIELENCFNTAFFWDYTKQGSDLEFPSHEQVKWTKENHFRGTTLIKISKKVWKENWKKFEDTSFSDQDYWNQTNMYPKIDYVILQTYHYTPDQIKKIKSLGGKIINQYDKIVFSINSENGIVTEMKIYSSEYFDHILKEYLTLSYGNINTNIMSALTKKEKEDYRDTFYRVRDKGPISSDHYIIEAYAGGIIKAKHEEKIIGRQLIIDLNTNTIKTKTQYDRKFQNYRCPNNYADSGSDQGPSGSSGTAFFINSRGLLITNNHVVEGCESQKISYRNKDHVAKIIATDKTLDLALLKTKIKPKSYIEFTADEPKKLNEIFVAGYPLGKGLSDDLKISSGIISSLKGFEDNSNEIQIDAPINPGNSGGPIINKKGLLVGIAVSGLAKDQTEGINFGIKSSAAESFLKSNKIKPIKSSNSKAKSNDDLLNILEEGTVYTYCE